MDARRWLWAPLKAAAEAALVVAMGLAAVGLAVVVIQKIATAKPANAAAAKYASYTLKRTKAEATWARWQYKLSFTPTKNYASARLSWVLPADVRISGSGVSQSNGQTTRMLKNVRAGKTVSVVFWAWSSQAKKLCFTVKASTGQRSRACNPKPPAKGIGQSILSHYAVSCTGNSQYPNCLHDGVANLRVDLDDECGNCYEYGNSGVPVTVTLYPVSGFTFSGPQAAGFTYKVKVLRAPGTPKPTKKDKTLHWATINGQKAAVWPYGHLADGAIAELDFTITVPAGTGKVCLTAEAVSVWAAPVQSASPCFYDPSVNSP